MSYENARSQIVKIKNKYTSAGDVLFRCGLYHLIDVGARNLTPEAVEETKKEILERHASHAKSGSFLIMSSDFEISIVECAAELASLEITDLLIFIQREMQYDGGDSMPSYSRLLELTQSLGDRLFEINTEEEGLEELRFYFSDEELVSVLNFDESLIYGGRYDDHEL